MEFQLSVIYLFGVAVMLAAFLGDEWTPESIIASFAIALSWPLYLPAKAVVVLAEWVLQK